MKDSNVVTNTPVERAPGLLEHMEITTSCCIPDGRLPQGLATELSEARQIFFWSIKRKKSI